MFSTRLPDIPGLPPLEALLGAFLTALFFLFLAAAVFGPFIAACCEAVGRSKGRIFHSKAARQNAAMSLAAALPVSAALGGFLYYLIRDEPSLYGTPYAAPFIAVLVSAALALVLLVLYFCVWKKTGIPGKGHVVTGFLATFAAMAAGFSTLAFAHRYMHGAALDGAELMRNTLMENAESALAANSALENAEEIAGTMIETASDAFPFSLQDLTDFFLFPADSFFWPALLHILPLALGAAATCGALWMLLSRARTDFGRDYYNFALPFNARWALTGTLLSLPTAAFAYYRAGSFMLPELSHPPSLLLGGLCYGLPALSCLFWVFLLRSDTPLRHKPGIVLAFLCLLTGISAQALVLNEIIPSP